MGEHSPPGAKGEKKRRKENRGRTRPSNRLGAVRSRLLPLNTQMAVKHVQWKGWGTGKFFKGGYELWEKSSRGKRQMALTTSKNRLQGETSKKNRLVGTKKNIKRATTSSQTQTRGRGAMNLLTGGSIETEQKEKKNWRAGGNLVWGSENSV